jgi:MoaD family protein
VNVTIKFFTTLREMTGKGEDVVTLPENASMEDLLRRLSDKYGRKFEEYVFEKDGRETSQNLQFLIDGQSTATMQGIKTRLRPGCVVAIIPPVGGG